MTNATSDIRVNSILESIIANLTQLKSIIGNCNGVSLKTSVNTYDVETSDNVAYAPTFYRYIRPINPVNGEYFSQQGVTLRINLNYKKRQITFKYAICNHGPGETSFDKKMGKMITARRKSYTIPMWENEGPLLGCDLTSFIINAIEKKEVDIPPGDRRHILTQYGASIQPLILSKNPKNNYGAFGSFGSAKLVGAHTEIRLADSNKHACCGKCK